MGFALYMLGPVGGTDVFLTRLAMLGG